MRIRHKQTIKAHKQAQHGIVQIPVQLKPTQRLIYPPDNTMPFERWYLNAYLNTDARDRMYLPIQWTALYCNNNFGKCGTTNRMIQTVLNGLDKTKKYYTIVQYDDGILNDISHLDIKVFAMSGPRIDYPLPLLCTPHGFKFDCKRDIFASFVGRITHPIRQQMFDQLKHLPDYFLSMDTLPLKHYCEILARSKYVLCPRGYGKTSFRIQEAIDYGAIPVYISDDFIIPYASNKTIPPNEVDNIIHTGIHLFDPIWDASIDHYLKITDVNNNERLSNICKNKHLFTYAGCKQMILKELENDNTTPI
jgi:hypothetical protein